jgi:hypothetical protein
MKGSFSFLVSSFWFELVACISETAMGSNVTNLWREWRCAYQATCNVTGTSN